MTALWIVLGVLVLLALSVVVSYNRFVRQRNLVQESWRQVDVELKRRHADDRADDRVVAVVVVTFGTEEGLVDLHLVHGQLGEVGQR